MTTSGTYILHVPIYETAEQQQIREIKNAIETLAIAVENLSIDINKLNERIK